VAAALALAAAGCIDEPLPTPAAAEVQADLDRDALPPLYRKLYDYAFLPAVQADEQRVRLRIWLHYMEFDRYQLGVLSELVAFARREFTAVEEKNRQIVESYEPAVAGVYRRIWEAMERDASEDELATLADTLDPVKRREADLLAVRAASVRAVLDAEEPFLRTLRPEQDTRFADAVFALRHRLDPWANPGDFHALVGTVYVAGDFGTLTQPTYDPAEDHLNIGGLWSEDPQALAGPYFQDARRDVILYMLLLEPTLPEAIEAVRAERARRGEAGTEGVAPAEGVPGGAPAAVPGEPPEAVAPGLPSPGVPAAPSPGVPEPPTPGVPAPTRPPPE
jgi:hypothetical protein